MVRVELTGPDGHPIFQPSDEAVVGLLRKGDQYWESGSGAMGIDVVVSTSGAKRTMIVIARKALGVHLELYGEEGARDYLLSVKAGEEERAVAVWVGGEKHYLPASTFIPEPEAEEAILEFVRTGEASNASLWKRRSEVWWPDTED